MICQDCGVEAPTKYVSFHQNIGVLVMRFPKNVAGNLCKDCISRHFWSMTGITAVAGWWGMISFVVTPFFLINNIVRYIGCISLPPVPPGATMPVLSDEAIEKIRPHLQGLFDRLNGGEELESAVMHTAEKSGTTPGQVMLYAQAVVQAQREQ